MKVAEQPWTVLRVLNRVAGRIGREGLASPRLDAEVLLAHALSTERIKLYVEHDKPRGLAELARVRELVRRRLASRDQFRPLPRPLPSPRRVPGP